MDGLLIIVEYFSVLENNDTVMEGFNEVVEHLNNLFLVFSIRKLLPLFTHVDSRDYHNYDQEDCVGYREYCVVAFVLSPKPYSQDNVDSPK